jgi:hypothetical protein
MKQGFFDEHWCDANDNPAGGVTSGKGLTISWQNGPLGRGNERREANGAFVEDVIQAVRQRLEFYQTARGGTYACRENQQAIDYLTMAEDILDARTREREARQVEGLHRA